MLLLQQIGKMAHPLAKEDIERTTGAHPAETLPRLFAYPWRRLSLGAGAVVAIALLAATQGAVGIPLLEVGKIVLSHLPGVELSQTWPQGWDTIIWQIRLPRIVVAGLVGAALAMSGAMYQGLFRNPLADPYLIGVAAGAGLGATIIFISPIPVYWGAFSLVPLSAFATALTAVTLAYLLARIGGVASTTTLILAGVAIASIAAAGTTLLLMTSDQDVRPVLSWLLGSFASASWRQIPLLLPYLVPSLLVALAYGRILNVMQLDEEQARQLGVPVERVKLLLVASASLATAAAVSVSGLIGFVGLIAPHTVRLLWGHDYRSLVPMAMIMGAGFLILADLVARISLRPGELPVGVVTAFVGAPFFLYLLRQRKGGAF